MSKIESREFKINSLLVKAWFGLSIMAILVAILYIIRNEPLGGAWLGVAALWILNAGWRNRTPLVILKEDNITVNIVMLRKPKIVKWQEIKQIERLKRKILLRLANGKKIKILFSLINKAEREDLVEILQQAAAEFNISMKR